MIEQDKRGPSDYACFFRSFEMRLLYAATSALPEKAPKRAISTDIQRPLSLDIPQLVSVSSAAQKNGECSTNDLDGHLPSRPFIFGLPNVANEEDVQVDEEDGGEEKNSCYPPGIAAAEDAAVTEAQYLLGTIHTIDAVKQVIVATRNLCPYIYKTATSFSLLLHYCIHHYR